jgi:regulator-associated protein of mTOR
LQLDNDRLRLPPRIFCAERHDASAPPGPASPGRGSVPTAATPASIATASGGLVSKWRQREKLKTTAVALVMCLNIGVDPPDVIKISPCARLECWIDPSSMAPPKALETIGKNLQVRMLLRRSLSSFCNDLNWQQWGFPGSVLLFSCAAQGDTCPAGEQANA